MAPQPSGQPTHDLATPRAQAVREVLAYLQCKKAYLLQRHAPSPPAILPSIDAEIASLAASLQTLNPYLAADTGTLPHEKQLALDTLEERDGAFVRDAEQHLMSTWSREVCERIIRYHVARARLFDPAVRVPFSEPLHALPSTDSQGDIYPPPHETQASSHLPPHETQARALYTTYLEAHRHVLIPTLHEIQAAEARGTLHSRPSEYVEVQIASIDGRIRDFRQSLTDTRSAKEFRANEEHRATAGADGEIEALRGQYLAWRERYKDGKAANKEEWKALRGMLKRWIVLLDPLGRFEWVD